MVESMKNKKMKKNTIKGVFGAVYSNFGKKLPSGRLFLRLIKGKPFVGLQNQRLDALHLGQ